MGTRRPTTTSSERSPTPSRSSEQVTHLSRRIEALEERFPPEHRTNRRPELPSDPELVHKILYACLSDEHITEKRSYAS